MDFVPVERLANLLNKQAQQCNFEFLLLLLLPGKNATSFKKRRGPNIIYIGLTDEEAVGLAIQHQLDQNRTHSLTFMDRARQSFERFVLWPFGKWKCLTSSRPAFATSIRRNT